MLEGPLARTLLSQFGDRPGIALSSMSSIIEDGGEVVAQIAAHVQLWTLLIRQAFPEDGAERARVEASWWAGAGGTWSAIERLLETAEPGDDGTLTVRAANMLYRDCAEGVSSLSRRSFGQRSPSSCSSCTAPSRRSSSPRRRTGLLGCEHYPFDPASRRRPRCVSYDGHEAVSNPAQFLRALDAMTGEAPTPATREMLLSQAKTDTYAAFKLRIWPDAHARRG
jgi:hypothetical protein